MDIICYLKSFFETTQVSTPEAVMLICFGLSWPVSVIKALKTKRVGGKSPLFMSLIAVGYLSGITHKLLYSQNLLIVLYIFNLSMILTDLWLYVRYSFRERSIIKVAGEVICSSKKKTQQIIGIRSNEQRAPLAPTVDHILFKRS